MQLQSIFLFKLYLSPSGSHVINRDHIGQTTRGQDIRRSLANVEGISKLDLQIRSTKVRRPRQCHYSSSFNSHYAWNEQQLDIFMQWWTKLLRWTISSYTYRVMIFANIQMVEIVKCVQYYVRDQEDFPTITGTIHRQTTWCSPLYHWSLISVTYSRYWWTKRMLHVGWKI